MKIELTGKEKRDRIIAGLEKTYEKLLQFKKEKNSPLIISDKGKIRELSVNELPLTYRPQKKKTL